MTPDEAANVTAQLSNALDLLHEANERAYFWQQHAITYKAQRDALQPSAQDVAEAPAPAPALVDLDDARALLGL